MADDRRRLVALHMKEIRATSRVLRHEARELRERARQLRGETDARPRGAAKPELGST
jgi:hypothetical protein